MGGLGRKVGGLGKTDFVDSCDRLFFELSFWIFRVFSTDTRKFDHGDKAKFFISSFNNFRNLGICRWPILFISFPPSAKHRAKAQTKKTTWIKKFYTFHHSPNAPQSSELVCCLTDVFNLTTNFSLRRSLRCFWIFFRISKTSIVIVFVLIESIIIIVLWLVKITTNDQWAIVLIGISAILFVKSKNINRFSAKNYGSKIGLA